jgi:hypothetical protein
MLGKWTCSSASEQQVAWVQNEYYVFYELPGEQKLKSPQKHT